jgi:hypothetical protein
VQPKLAKPSQLKQRLHQSKSKTINAQMEWLTLLPMKACCRNDLEVSTPPTTKFFIRQQYHYPTILYFVTKGIVIGQCFG